MAVDAHSTARTSLRKKGNRSKLSRLGREGPVSLVQLRSGAELREVIDLIADYCDLRQGAINETTPFRSDPLKRQFYLAMMDEPKLLHASVLMAGTTLVAAHLGPIDKQYVSLGVITHSPFAARHSPAKLLLHLLAEHLGEQGYREFDLTPGGDYKARFASREDQVPTVSLFFSRWSFLLQRFVRGTVAAAKHVSQALGIEPRPALERLRPGARLAVRAARRPDRAGMAAIRRASRWLLDAGEYRVYRMSSEAAGNLNVGGVGLRVNAVADLLQYEPAAAGDTRRADFLRTALRRLEKGQLIFTYAEDGLLLHHSWLIPCTDEAGSDYGHRYGLAEPAALLWNGYTHPAARGRGLHQASLRARARHVMTNQLAPWIVTGVRSENGPSRHNIEKLGFDYAGSAWMKRRLGRSERWLTGSFLESLPAER
jgi:ribosomal protein S18 acetylase RimI-like enzyme